MDLFEECSVLYTFIKKISVSNSIWKHMLITCVLVDATRPGVSTGVGCGGGYPWSNGHTPPSPLAISPPHSLWIYSPPLHIPFTPAYTHPLLVTPGGHQCKHNNARTFHLESHSILNRYILFKYEYENHRKDK